MEACPTPPHFLTPLGLQPLWLLPQQASCLINLPCEFVLESGLQDRNKEVLCSYLGAACASLPSAWAVMGFKAGGKLSMMSIDAH